MDRLGPLTRNRVTLLMDGAMGTELWARGTGEDQCLEALNLEDSDLLRGVHADYLAAGSDIIRTNTFGANRFRLTAFGLELKVAALNRAGVLRAREAVAASGRSALIAGSVGPLGPAATTLRLKASARFLEQADGAFAEQIAVLAAAGVHLIVLETFTALSEIEMALAATRRIAPALPVIALMSIPSSDDCSDLVRLRKLGASAVGFNCGEGAQTAVNLARKLGEVDAGPLAALPSAGLPVPIDGRLCYPAGPEMFGELALNLARAGIQFVGGCCGTGPSHITAMRVALDAAGEGVKKPSSRAASEVGEDARA